MSYWSCWRSDKPWEIFTPFERKSNQLLGQREKREGGEKMDVEEDEQELRGVKKKMQRQKGEKDKGRRESGDSLQWFFIKASGES